MNRKDIVIGLAILAIIAGLVFFAKRSKNSGLAVPSETPTIEQKVQDRFKYTVPAGVDKIELKDVSGGNSFAVATRKFENQTFDVTVLADLPDPEAGSFYEAWIQKDNINVPLGKLSVAKGGYLVNFTSSKDYSDYNKFIVTIEKKDDLTPETYVLEGSFQ
jgi:hypothetical protein